MDITSNYGDAMSRLLPGTFVPDIGSQQSPKSEPLDGVTGVTGGAASSFKDTLASMIDGVNDKMAAGDQKTQALATGKSNDFDGTIKAVEEGQLAMSFTMAIRNKLMDAYTEIERMQM